MVRKYISIINISLSIMLLIDKEVSKISDRVKHFVACFSGVVWGIISLFWVGSGILAIGDFLRFKESYNYELEHADSVVYGSVIIAVYFIFFLFIILYLYKKKYMKFFLPAMIIGGIITIVFLRIRWLYF